MIMMPFTIAKEKCLHIGHTDMLIKMPMEDMYQLLIGCYNLQVLLLLSHTYEKINYHVVQDIIHSQCSQKTFMVHKTTVLLKFIKSLIDFHEHSLHSGTHPL